MYLADELRQMANSVETGGKLAAADIDKILVAAVQFVEMRLGGKPVFYRGPLSIIPAGVGGA